MPIYEYRCKACGHDLEALQKVTDAPLKKCPECGKRTLARLMSAPSFRLKGGGWYETDFKSDGEKKRNLVDSGDGGKDGGESGKDSGSSKSDATGGATESTAAAKPETASGGAAKSDPKPAAKPVSKPAKSVKPASKKAPRGAAK